MKLLLRALLFISLLLTLIVGVGQPISARTCRDDQDCGEHNGPGPREPTPTPAPGPSPIDQKYAALGGQNSFLGVPTLPKELVVPVGSGRYRHYQHGSIYWSPSTEAHEVHGLIREKWASLGWEQSYLGYPTSDELSTPDGVGRYSQFQNGIIYWTPQQGAHDAPHPIQNVSLVKEQSKPDVYLVVSGYKLWIRDEQEFAAAGFTWDKVQVVPDGALDGYQRHFFSAPATIKPSDVFVGTDCKNYDTVWGRMHPNCQNVANLIRKDVVVAGWLVDAPFVNNSDHGVEDIHYNIMLDPNFIDRMYGPGGLSAVLDHAVYPGNPYVPDNPLPFEDVDPSGVRRGVDYSSFIIANNDYDIHGELNAWHVKGTGGLWTRHFVGRGTAPGGWRNIAFGDDSDAWWPWDVTSPDGRATTLQKGDYVVMRGALWQDGDHEEGEKDPLSPWNSGNTRGHSGWTEIHPVDWIVRVNDPGPPVWKSAQRVIYPCENCSKHLAWNFGPEHVHGDTSLPFQKSGLSSRVFEVYDVQELIDGRFTQISTVKNLTVSNRLDHVEVNADIVDVPGVQGRFKASYVVTWREADVNDVVWVEDNVPAGATPAGFAEGWNWSTNPTRYGKPLSGTRSHQSDNVMSIHQHLFSGATDQLSVNPGDTLFAYVYLDPKDIPYEVMLQWNDGVWEHRAYWGANLIPWGTDGTASRRYMGPITVAGEWLRLEVPANLVGLDGRSLNGMAFTLFGGRASWDRAGVWTAPLPKPKTSPSPEPTEDLFVCRVKPYLPQCK
jgi:hypothetical protein